MSESNGLPPGWVLAQLQDVVAPKRLVVKPMDFPMLPFIGMEHVEPETMRLMGTVPASTLRSNALRFYPDDVLYGRLRPYLNKVFQPNFEGLCSAEFIVFGSSELDSAYLRYFLNSWSFKRFASSLNTGDRPRVDWDQLKGYSLPIPPLAEQRRIVAAIEEQFARLDAGVEALERTQDNLKRYRASVLKAAVEGRLTEEWREEHPDAKDASALLERILEERRARWEEAQLARYAGKEQNPPKNWHSKYKEPAAPDTADLPELPDGWIWVSAEAFISSIRSGSSAVPHDEEIGVPVLRSSSIRPGVIDFDDVRYLDNEGLTEDNFLRERDILFTRLSGSLDYVGNCAVVNDLGNRRIQYPDRLFCARLVDSERANYLSWYFASPAAREAIKTVAKSTAGHQRISLDAITKQAVPFPPLVEQEEIVAEVERRLSVMEEVEAQVEVGLKRAERLRQAILKRAFEGKLVPQDPSDEPASVLLERIRTERAASEKKPKNKKASGKGTRGYAASLSRARNADQPELF